MSGPVQYLYGLCCSVYCAILWFWKSWNILPTPCKLEKCLDAPLVLEIFALMQKCTGIQIMVWQFHNQQDHDFLQLFPSLLYFFTKVKFSSVCRIYVEWWHYFKACSVCIYTLLAHYETLTLNKRKKYGLHYNKQWTLVRTFFNTNI